MVCSQTLQTPHAEPLRSPCPARFSGATPAEVLTINITCGGWCKAIKKVGEAVLAIFEAVARSGGATLAPPILLPAGNQSEESRSLSKKLVEGKSYAVVAGINDYKHINKLFEKPSRVLIASGGNEPVTDAGGKGHSIFSDVLITALKEPFQEVFTAEELMTRHLKESVAGRTEQTPEYKVIRNSGHDGGDFIFVKRK